MAELTFTIDDDRNISTEGKEKIRKALIEMVKKELQEEGVVITPAGHLNCKVE
ncbi:MAG: hypothetical protein KME64_07165 [Scytonematopsis contorta HA4267-MV1]|nr:hypothetical protein [Scytonematopsis contorta HA4267-MV1]